MTGSTIIFINEQKKKDGAVDGENYLTVFVWGFIRVVRSITHLS